MKPMFEEEICDMCASEQGIYEEMNNIYNRATEICEKETGIKNAYYLDENGRDIPTKLSDNYSNSKKVKCLVIATEAEDVFMHVCKDHLLEVISCIL